MSSCIPATRDDQAARVVLEHLGQAVVPPFAGFVIHDAHGSIKGAVIISHFDGEDCEIQCDGFQYWSIGAARIVLRYAFDLLGCSRLSARTLAGNDRSADALLAIGFKQEGVKRRALDGTDVILFGLLREDCRVRL